MVVNVKSKNLTIFNFSIGIMEEQKGFHRRIFLGLKEHEFYSGNFNRDLNNVSLNTHTHTHTHTGLFRCTVISVVSIEFFPLGSMDTNNRSIFVCQFTFVCNMFILIKCMMK